MNTIEYERFVSTHRGRVFGYLRKITTSVEQAEDICQSTFGKLWVHIDNIPTKKAFNWCCQVGKREMINQYKKNKRIVRFRDDEECRFVGDSVDVSKFDVKDIIREELNNLTPIQRKLILLRDLKGYTYGEIGDKLNITEPQVKVYLFRARKQLKDKLKCVYYA